MLWFHVVLSTCAIGVVLFLFIFNRSERFNLPSMFLEKAEDGIIIRQYPIARMLPNKGQVIAVDSVSKVQLAKNCLSVFQHSGAAYDMWVPSKFESDLLAHAKALFPNAEFVRV